MDLNPRKNKPDGNIQMGTRTFYFDTHGNSNRLMPTGWIDGLTREIIMTGWDKNGYRYSCKKSKTNEDDLYTDHRHGCTALLYMDDWEFKDDYPW